MGGSQSSMTFVLMRRQQDTQGRPCEDTGEDGRPQARERERPQEEPAGSFISLLASRAVGKYVLIVEAPVRGTP